MRLKIGLIAAVLALVAAACGGDDGDNAADASTTAAPAETTTAPEATTAAPETTAASSERALTLAATSLGDVLVDNRGGALYLFVPDAQGPSVCYDECAAAWPPLTGEIAAGEGVDASLLGSVARDDGALQATYNGWPLYYFASDLAAGDTNGQGLNDVWFVLSAAGEGIGLEDTQAAPAGATIALGTTSLGEILVDGDGNALYLFVPDAQGASTCYDQCAEAWPPLTGEFAAGDGVDASLLGSVARDDGALQATYNGWPLYYFASDLAAGDTNGQGLNDVWYVLSAAGDAIL